jgi:hypothetical protein
MAQFKEHSEVERPAWLGEAWEDNSWHNDACPQAVLYLEIREYPQAVIQFWINYPPAERELGPAFEVRYLNDWGNDSSLDELLYRGEDEAAAQMWERAARTAKSMIDAILARPDLNACKTFAELHNHCDANVLGDVEAMTAEGEAHRDGTDDPEVSITGWAFAVHDGALRIVELWMKGR